MAQLQFLFRDFVSEIDTIDKVTKKFIAPNSSGVFGMLKYNLEQIRGLPSGHSYRWGISQDLPLCTETSWGEYEIGCGGRDPIFAQIMSVWQIAPLGLSNPGSRVHRKFALTGQASTRVRLFHGSADEPGEELAMWRMEVGDDASPGCHFHVQVLGEKENPPFPHFLSVPRFPGMIMTPMAVLEFVLGELFQEKWKAHAAHETSAIKQWQSIQRDRLCCILKWQNEQVKSLLGSPWTALKWAKPPTDLFCGS